jgi:hypothetical protein
MQNDTPNDSPVFYDTTPNEELSPASDGTEGYEASMEDGAGRYDDSDEVSGDDGAHHEDGGNEASEDELPYRGDEYIHDGKDFPSPSEYNSWSNDLPSGSDIDGNDTNFIARLTVALQSEADYATLTRHAEIADSQASSDDVDNTVNHTASSIKVEVADSQADSDEPENTVTYAALLIKVEEADSQAGSDDLYNTAIYAVPSIKEEVADSQADSDELEVTPNYAASSGEEEMADWQAGSDHLDNTTNHATSSGDEEAADSQPDSDNNANEAPWFALKPPTLRPSRSWPAITLDDSKTTPVDDSLLFVLRQTTATNTTQTVTQTPRMIKTPIHHSQSWRTPPSQSISSCSDSSASIRGVRSSSARAWAGVPAAVTVPSTEPRTPTTPTGHWCRPARPTYPRAPSPTSASQPAL